jgi:hypothetical protein
MYKCTNVLSFSAEDWITAKSAWQYALLTLSHVMVLVWTRVVPAPLHPCLTTYHFTMVLMPFPQRWGNGVTTVSPPPPCCPLYIIFVFENMGLCYLSVDRKSPYRQIEPFKVRSTIAQYTIDCPSRFALGYLHTRLGITLVTCTTSLFTLASSDKLNVKYVICTRTWMNAMTICEHSYIILVLLLSQPVHHLWYLGHVYTKAIRLWDLRILVLSLVESLGDALLYYVWEPRAFMTPPKNPLVYERLYV